MMKLTLFFTLAACLHASAGGFAQTVTLSEKNASLERIFQEIKRQTGYDFFYQSELLLDARNVDIEVKNVPVAEALNICFRDQPFSFTIAEGTILIKPKAVATARPAAGVPPPVLIKGRIVDDKNGEPVIGASVMVKGGETGVTTSKEGEFVFVYNGSGKPVLLISHIGYVTKEVSLGSKEYAEKDYVTIRLILSDQNMASVEISTGMFKRNRESFTGVVSSFTGEQLKVIGNRNIIESLKTLDPSFIVVENNQAGSNPNTLPTIELRGKSSLPNTTTTINGTTTTTELNNQYTSDPNLPLFVLNGFPSTLAIINNLDINRVATVTILKDAASTAIWGSKAANGVVVIETKKPVAGELRMSYNADFLADAPDLSSYNMMNAAEKLEFERLAGVYTNGGFYSAYQGQLVYNQRLADIKRGVNTYWLNEPVRTGFTNGHSLHLTGGSNELLFEAGVNYRKQTGAMKGSDHQSWGGNIDLTYRKGKFNVINQLSLSGVTGNESPYGSFSGFVQTSPFLVKRNADGTIPRYADSTVDINTNAPGLVLPGSQVPVPNPLYNALLRSINKTNSLDIQNNLQGILTLSPTLMLQGGVQISSTTGSQIVFMPPESTSFDGTAITERGSYTSNQTKQRGYDANLMLSYGKIFAHAHTLNLLLRSDVNEQRSDLTGFKVIGYPDGTNGNPAFALKYDPYSTPPVSSSVQRQFDATSVLNYAYKACYMLDLTYTLNGNNAFGSNKKYRPSWAAGLGWNLQKEAFLRPVRWIDQLLLRANIGVTGNEKLGVYSSNSTYNGLASGSNIFGQSLDMTGLGNPNLQWQNTRQLSTSLEFNFLNNRISGSVNYYVKNTDPLIVGATDILPSSVGVEFPYPINVGEMITKGWEGNLRVSPIYRVKERVVWTLGLNGSKVMVTYHKFGNTLAAANKAQTENNGLNRYLDGYSPDDLWAVKSRGIDPASGQEIFQKKGGGETFSYDADDIVKVGNSMPAIQGILSSTLAYKRLTISINFRYVLDGYQMNDALYNKVENITFQSLKLNQDKRALYDRWKQPGDISQFKGIGLDTYTPISSRFIQKDSYLQGEAFSVGWDFTGDKWIHKLKMQGFHITLFTSNTFRLSSIKTERGIDYPFTRTGSLNIYASF